MTKPRLPRKKNLLPQISCCDRARARSESLFPQMTHCTIPMHLRSGYRTKYEWDIEFSNERGVHQRAAAETESDRRRWWGESTLCLWLPNEALLIQIRVNDYLIIPILQRAPAPSVLCPVNLQRGNPESERLSPWDVIICRLWSGCWALRVRTDL